MSFVEQRRRFINYPRAGYGPVRRWLPSWRFPVGLALFVGALSIGVFVGAWTGTAIPHNLDSVNHQVTTIYYEDGVTPIGTLASQTRELISYSDLPAYVGNAVVASEDASFWTNHGIDPRGIARAVYNNLRGGPLQGASTLTQQYVERYYLDSTTSYVGKAKEAIIALKVARAQPKEQVLEGYLNTIYWGRGTYGVQAASQAYFGKDAKDLTVSEAALLAGIIPAPTIYDPAENPDLAKIRFDRVIALMEEQGYLSSQEAAEATFPATVPPVDLTEQVAGQGGYLINEVLRELQASPQFSDNPDALHTRGFRIVTTIRQVLQDEAAAIYQDSIPWTGEAAASPNLQMALVSIDPTDGEIWALYGGEDYLTRQFNFATDGRAQGGSTFKPFTLIAALQDGHLLSERYDGNNPRVFDMPGQAPWEVWNFGRVNFGEIDLIQATANSVNTVYAELNFDIGPERTVQVAHQLGIPDVPQGQPGYIMDNPANVLGTDSVRPIDLARAYATIAGGGYQITPHIVREVRALNGDLVYTGPTARKQVVDPQIIAAATYALEKVVTDGSATTALAVVGPDGEPRPMAGKTGTPTDNKSAWFAGFTPQLVTVVGLHQDSADGAGEEQITAFGQWKDEPNGMTGGSFPVTAWTQFMQVALDGLPAVDFPHFTPPRPSASPSAAPTSPPECAAGELPEETGCIPPADDSADTDIPDPQEGWILVPDNLVGQQADNVAIALRAVGLLVVTVDQESTSPVGTVVSVSSAGQSVPPGSTVTVSVSTGSTAPSPAPTTPPEPTPQPPEPSPDPAEPPAADTRSRR